MWSLLYLILGIAVVIKSADYIISGAASLSLRFKLSPLIIGLTIVSLGTTAPELFIAITSAVEGETQIALGNSIGSNIANMLLVLGVAAFIHPLKLKHNITWKQLPMALVAPVLLLILSPNRQFDKNILSLDTLFSKIEVGVLSTRNGLILLLFFVIFLFYTILQKTKVEKRILNIKKFPLKKSLFLILIGFIGLTAGSKMTVDNAVELAKVFNVTNTLIGLTLIAVGTSLPELVTAITASFKRQSDIAVGNILGASAFNILLALGAASLIRSVPITGINYADAFILVVVTLVTIGTLVFFKRHEVTRKGGVFLLSLYVIYLIFIILRG